MVPALLVESAADPEDWGFLSWACARVVMSTNEARIAQSRRRIITSDQHGLPLIIHLLWIAAMSCGVREEGFSQPISAECQHHESPKLGNARAVYLDSRQKPCIDVCLVKTESGYEINSLHRCRVTCYMDEDRLVRSLAKNNPALSRFLDIIAPSDTMKREPDPLLEA